MADKILVVDSDMATRRGAMIALMPAGYELSVAETAFEALAVAQRTRPDLIVLGASLSDAAGLQLVGRLFSQAETAATPVLVIAPTAEAADAAERAGARAAVTGRDDRVALLHAVADHIHRPGALAGAPESLLTDPDRLAVVESLRPGPDGEASYDRFTNLAAKLLGAPVSIISLVDSESQQVASQVGRDAPGTPPVTVPLTHSFCQFAITSREPLRIDDSTAHPLVQGSPAIEDDHIQAYLGIPLLVGGADDGQAVGALCVTDSVPRHWTDDETEILGDLAGILADQLGSSSRRGRHAVA